MDHGPGASLSELDIFQGVEADNGGPLLEPNTIIENRWTPKRNKTVTPQSMLDFTLDVVYRLGLADDHFSVFYTGSITNKSRVSFSSLISGDRCTRLLAQSVGHFVPRSTIAAQLGVGKISTGLF